MDTYTITSELFKKNVILSRLQHLYDAPEILYLQGTIPQCTLDEKGLLTPRILTIVGSRDHSHYAKDVIHELISHLTGYPVIILSGLALGVDSLAHRAALLNNLTTIAIPGSGLSRKVLYPRENERLADEILHANGCLISELPDEKPAMKWTFLSRNRIMATLADAVLVVEAREKSGTLVTARHALELGKNIGIVPGSIFSEHLKGSHDLLRDGATPIFTSSDLLNLLSLQEKTMLEEKQAELPLLSHEEKILFELLSSPLPRSELLEKSKLDTSTFLVALTSLEMYGFIKTTLHEVRKVV